MYVIVGENRVSPLAVKEIAVDELKQNPVKVCSKTLDNRHLRCTVTKAGSISKPYNVVCFWWFGTSDRLSLSKYICPIFC